MYDRERVINALEYMISDDCTDTQLDYDEEIEAAIAMLKGQEKKAVKNMALDKDRYLIASCPNCNASLTRAEHRNFCGYCGQAVKWE